MSKVAIIGSGYIGRSFTLIFARAGYQVTLYDVVPGATKKALEILKTDFEMLKKNELLKEKSVEECMNLLSTTENISEALKGAFYVQECTPEKLELKQQVFKELDAHIDPTTILSSSTSTIPASKFTEHLKHRSRCLISHPVNPPHAVPLIEIIPAPWTDKEVVQKTRDLWAKVGQEPVVLNKEVDGFLINRLQYAVLAEAFRLVEDGVASPEDIDKCISAGLGRRWSFLGPFSVVDLNHSNGLQDMEDIYLPGIYRCLDTMDNSRKFKKETFDTVKNAWREKYPVEDIPKKVQWRSARLLALAKHQQECKNTIDKEFS
eukprot:TRINITY_DN118_c1_g1_i1.p1 TRINITY_DN118_c1_g1~~TRINITY_DN118_c1_g1_i1.p1  ORF type:complete len:343 (-),score=74.68 TRINITY_DN118_c1_g1_i1:41-997(-)